MVKYSGRMGATTELRLRLPEALAAHLEDEAARHKRSLNAEVLELLMAPRRKVYGELSQRAREALEDACGEDWYGLTQAGLKAHSSAELAARSDDEVLADVDWLPGSLRYET